MILSLAEAIVGVKSPLHSLTGVGQFSLYSRSIESFRLLTFHGLGFVGLLGQNPVARQVGRRKLPFFSF
jgi:hypothetical protein